MQIQHKAVVTVHPVLSWMLTALGDKRLLFSHLHFKARGWRQESLSHVGKTVFTAFPHLNCYFSAMFISPCGCFNDAVWFHSAFRIWSSQTSRSSLPTSKASADQLRNRHLHLFTHIRSDHDYVSNDFIKMMKTAGKVTVVITVFDEENEANDLNDSRNYGGDG